MQAADAGRMGIHARQGDEIDVVDREVPEAVDEVDRALAAAEDAGDVPWPDPALHEVALRVRRRRQRGQHRFGVAFQQAVAGIGLEQGLHFDVQRGIARGQFAQTRVPLRRRQVHPGIEQVERLPRAFVGGHEASSMPGSPPISR